MIRILGLALMVLTLGACATSAPRVEIRFDVPEGLENYTGVQPVTFGIPFERGVLKKADGLRVVDERGNILHGHCEVTATWAPDSNDVKWLLVDVGVALENGKPPKAFLEFGPNVPVVKYKLAVPKKDDLRFSADQFVLVDGNGIRYLPSETQTVVERVGPGRSVVKVTGKYVSENGRWIADFITRYRVYGRDFVRVYHTLVWQTDASVKIGDLTFVPNVGPKTGKVQVGLDGKRVTLDKDARVTQTDWNKVVGAAQGKQLDGWGEVSDGKGSLFVGLRWPWQQYPTAFSNENGRLAVHLIGPETPMSLKAEDVAVKYTLKDMKKWNLRIFTKEGRLWNVKHNGPEARPHVTPRGIAKTWEMVLWFGDEKVPSQVKNTLTQHPVLAYADPAFACRASLPSPMSPRDVKRFPLIERALERAYDWHARENPYDGDFGVWNYGDIQWCWTGRAGYTVYRYWMNHGKGWSIAPWALWLRSGDRRYWENGEANSRHCMDVDMCHVPEYVRAEDGKVCGGQNHYSAIHWGYGPGIATFYVDSEYLPNYYFMTGYERARDVMLERVELLARDDWKRRVEHFKAEPDTR